MLITTLLDCIFPKICVTCKALVSENDTLCVDCWNQLEFLSKPYCPKCSIPQEISQFDHLGICKCITEGHMYTQVYSILHYKGVAKKLLLNLKFYNDFRAAKMLGKLAGNQFINQFTNMDVICVVPLSASKIIKRMFNQCAIILKYVDGIKHKLMLDLLIKTKDTKSQNSLSKKERHKNLVGAFALNPKFLSENDYKMPLKGLKIGLFDDVVTTGSTAHECSKILLKNGAKEVHVFCIARA